MSYLSCRANATTAMCEWMFEEIKEEDKRSARARANNLKKLEQSKEEKPMAHSVL
jgi:hypothetical protein